MEYRIGEYTRNEPETSAREHRQYTIGNIRFAYDNDVKIREKVLRQMNTLVPGEVYRESDVNNTYRRLSALKVFRGINLGMVPREDSTVVDCNINLSRSSIQGFKVNLEASSNSNGLLGISPQLTYYHKNIFRGGEWLNLGFLGNFQFKLDDNIRSNEFGVTGGLSFPKLIAVPPRFVRDTRSGGRTEVNLSYSIYPPCRGILVRLHRKLGTEDLLPDLPPAIEHRAPDGHRPVVPDQPAEQSVPAECLPGPL